MHTEEVVRVRGADELAVQTLCPAEPRTVGEPGGGPGASALTGWRLYLPSTADVTGPDRVRVRGTLYSVLGQPAAWSGGGLVVDVADVWTAQCTIRHPGGTRGDFDPATGLYPTDPFEPHYTGGCQVWVLSPAEQQQLFAEDLITEVGYLVVVDLDDSTGCRVGDLVEITSNDANGDSLLVGQTLQVRSFDRGSMPWQRDLRCTLLLPSS